MRTNLVSIVLVCGLYGLSTGCAVSESVGSVVESASSPFEWSSSSLASSSEEKSAYRQDVSELTVAYATQGGDLDAFRHGVASLAEQRGITAWEADSFTCASIGYGVRRAAYDSAAADHFAEKLFGQNDDAVTAYRAGYVSVQ